MRSLTLAPLRTLPSSPLLSAGLHLLFFRSPFSSSSSSSSSFSSSASSSSSSSSSRRTESQENCCDEESKSIRISVWWDYENCSIPVGVNAYRISNRILSALRSNGIHGPVSINAFGNICPEMPHAAQGALISTGISFVNVPISGQNDASELLMAELNNWTTHNPPPAHFFLISNNSVYETILHHLRLNNYNVLLSCSHNHNQVKASLYSASTFLWPWIPLAKGEDFTPLQFNHPPLRSYGHDHKGPLVDPFDFEKELMERVTDPEWEDLEHKIRITFNRALCYEFDCKKISKAAFVMYTCLMNTMPCADLFSLGRELKLWPTVKKS